MVSAASPLIMALDALGYLPLFRVDDCHIATNQLYLGLSLFTGLVLADWPTGAVAYCEESVGATLSVS